MKHSHLQKGQMVLMVLLIMLVGLTVATGVFLNSLSQVKNTSSQESAQRAFNAAESGIEKYLSYNIGSLVEMSANGFSSDGLTISGEVKTCDDSQKNCFQATVLENDVAAINLAGGTATEIQLEWDSCADLLVEKWTADDINLRTHFSHNEGECSHNQQILSIDTNNDKILRIRPIYDQANLTITSTVGDLPAQQIVITSEASEESGETKAIKVTKSFEDLPPIFDYVLFSGGNLAK
ncbi:hypothetical protein GYA19_00095 [Candidatus Beckwithbacteria bacterium]|nr:hypothetical protein [Candidatus Beckwithbacteria bacterium]